MAQSTITYKTLYELDPSLKSEELFRFYNKFNNICNNEGDTDNGCIHDGIYDNVDVSVKDFYKNTASNFKIINDNSSQYFHGMTSDSNKRCIYFKYWFYDEVITKKYNNTKVNNFFEWWKQTNQKVCANCECKLSKIRWDEIHNLKKMYDVILLYGKNQDEASSGKQGTLSHTVIGIFGTAFGLFLLLLILYKFTPFRLWISPRIRNYKRMWNKITRKDCESLLDKSVSQQMQSDNRKYNISYHVE
ncbi:PIR Superfamily Protein [Plasmodium ovale wallikeri]|uniref:PIR Superfamily Protein n=1 Tax=Plasmodium ovale wallikeri TaxID=864142 RepID=A0A1A9AJ09_PLAOA|nr:PIR Superfamily Protein [Plasmodium ovale wallikeri]SBT56166.1 PIR Superfamily Protein [Plasmodium ovale wallikeri]